MKVITTDILVIGSGASGLYFALKAADKAKVTVVTKKKAEQSNTNYAQGGIASVIDVGDSFDLHTSDTILAGKGLCDEEAVRIMVKEGPEKIKELIRLGVRFSREGENGPLQLGREGGHSKSRIVHFGDLTGRELEETLIKSCRAHSSIQLVEGQLAIDLVKDGTGRISGACLLEIENNDITAYLAHNTVLASGGAGKIYLYTSNPDVATGDGIAMAYNAGAKVANLEFVQFHPTCLYHPDAKSRLISEALRGEGAILRNQAGVEFMENFDPRKELASRDIVARAIDTEMKKSGDKYVLLDISHRPGEWLKKRFPYVFQSCLEFGIDISKDPIPVVPAAHYMVGGVLATINGETNLEGLYAIGEVACSRIHGANRLASNSLLETIVMADRCAELLSKSKNPKRNLKEIQVEGQTVGDPDELQTVIVDHDWDLARRIMWDYVGIVRSDERLGIAKARIAQIKKTVDHLYSDYGVSADIIELRNIVLVSSLIIESALLRKESRGLHFNTDYPETDPDYEKDTVLLKES
ncbi:MAG: L-aspartate oxidase [Candidatus Krumholzibacteriota bacterium]|nr:L-aspartate oxidase [Candidatus Krumholzibacteriota bacterium]